MLSRKFLLLTVFVLVSSPQESECDVFGRMFKGASSMARSSYDAVTSYTTRKQQTTTTTTTTPPSDASADGDSPSESSSDADEINSDFESQCLVNRGANLRSPPQVFFFSNAEHGEQSYGCNPNANITLGLDGQGANFGDDPNSWKLDVASIQRRLLDTGTYDKSLPTYLLVHGFMADWNGDTWMCQLKDKILNETDANVFIVDWSGGSKPMLPIDYGAAVGNTKYVGQLLAKFIVTLMAMTNQEDASKFHMIGHSLGAHISGFVGYALGSLRLGRITGLDPAGPCWTSGFGQNATHLSSTGELSAGRRRLSPRSAQLVVALHTDAGRFGLNENCGHYDIYVNGGSSPQPICKSVADRVDNLLNLRLMDAVDLGDLACAHGYAHSITDAYLPSLLKLLANRLTRDVSQQAKQEKFAPADEQCFLVGYRCASWAAFKKGECGLSSSENEEEDLSYAIDALAIDPHIDAPRLAQAAREAAVWKPLGESVVGDNLNSDSDDEHINEEEFKVSLQSSLMPSALVSDSPNKQWQHFIKTSSSKLSFCAYTYQLVIAIDPTDSTDQCKLYVEIPLDQQPGLLDVHTNEKATSRIVQVSHKVAQGSWARQQFTKLGANLTENSGQLDFYTALITFDAASSDECRSLVDSDEPKTSRDRWYLCESLSRIEGARLLAPDNGVDCMKQVKWVALAHLSGSNADIRHDGSYLFEPDTSQIEQKKEDATRVQQHRRGGLVNKLVGGVQGGVKCLTSAVDPTQQSDCESSLFGGVNLKYAAPLGVVSDEDRRQVLRI